ncbi:MAG: hypothetical protein CMC96_01910 [Flavobacteriales bacterium]|nr:hypothetical protein [Flavobacteriales bacterium]|tara:strand:- start:204 stop:419 length:216 start_codon:yes stop_codon:yes gene_type:complete
METLRIELLNPKAKKILNSLKELKLIKIKKSNFSREKFIEFLKETRQDETLSLEEIQKEVEAVRDKRTNTK